MTRPQLITNITTTIQNLRQGDYLFLDIDGTILRNGISKYTDPTLCPEENLPNALRHLQESGIPVIGLTARKTKHSEITNTQLKEHGIKLDHIIFSPSEDESPSQKVNTKGKTLTAFLNQLPKCPKRALIIDNELSNLDDIAANWPNELSTQLVVFHYQPVVKLAPVPEFSAEFPKDLTSFTKVESLGGGTKSTFKISSKNHSKTLVLKHGAHTNAIKIELLCNAIYHALGIPIPKFVAFAEVPVSLAKKLGINPHEIVYVSEYIEDGMEPNIDALSKIACDHFIIHVLIGNTDFIKVKTPNYIQAKNGVIYTIDAGGNFLYRALGEKRRENPALVAELFTLRDPQFNVNAKILFQDLTEQDIRAQVIAVINKKPLLEKIIWDASILLQLNTQLQHQFLELFTERLDRLVTRYCPELQIYTKQDKLAHTNQTAAGVLTYTIIESTPHILLSKRTKHRWWDNFGGGSDAGDRYLFETATREVAEESNKQLLYYSHSLATCPSHDLITFKKDGSIFIYRMYLALHSYVNPAKFNDFEHTDYQWVPLPNILHAIKYAEIIREENQETIIISAPDNSKDIILYPPLYKMLQQEPVLSNLERLLANKPLQNLHTQSFINQSKREHLVLSPRPLISPSQIRQEIANTLVNHSQLMREFKVKHRSVMSNLKKAKPHLEQERLSQSELHLKVILGEQYQPDNLVANIQNLFNILKSSGEIQGLNLTEEENERLVQICLQCIEQEKNLGDKYIYLYHACDSQIAFAYAIYTMLYQLLRTDNNWPVFRADNQPFLRFERNVQQFMQHYTNANGAIDNFLPGYHECGISTNLFLFGNHENDSSFSFSYFLNNKTSRHFSLSSILQSLFLPYKINSKEINRLTALFPAFSEQNGSMLYQIAISIDEVNQLTYPAGRQGKHMPYYDANHSEVSNITGIMDKLWLTVKTNQIDESIKQYISQLQVRLFALPNKQLQTQEFSRSEIMWPHRSKQKQLSLDMQRMVESIAHAVFSRFAPNPKKLDNGTASLHILPHIHRANQLNFTLKYSVTDLVYAVFKRDVQLVEEILLSTPTLKKIRFSYSYVTSNGWNNYTARVEKQLPLRIIINHFGIHHFLIKTCFDLEDFIQFFNNEFSPILFEQLLLHLSPNDRLKIVKLFLHKISNGELFGNVLHLLPQHARLTIINNYPYKITNDKTFFVIIDGLTIEQLLMLAKNKSKLIANANRLANLLERLPIEARIELATAYEDEISMGGELALILPLLPYKLGFAIKHAHKIKNGRELATVLSCLNLEDRLIFAKNYAYIIKTASELAAVLSTLNACDRFEFAQKHAEKIQTDADLLQVIKTLNQNEAFIIAVEHLDKIRSIFSLNNIICVFPSSEVRFAYLVKARNIIKSAFDIPHVLSRLSEEEHVIAFANICINKVHSVKELVYFLSPLPLEFRYGFVTCYLGEINNSDEVISIIKLLPEQSRWRFVNTQIHLINDGNVLATILDYLTEDDCLTCATICISKIKNLQELEAVVKFLPEDDQKPFARSFLKRNQHTRSLSLQDELKLLSSNKKDYPFLRSLLQGEPLEPHPYNHKASIGLFSSQESAMIAKPHTIRAKPLRQN